MKIVLALIVLVIVVLALKKCAKIDLVNIVWGAIKGLWAKISNKQIVK